MERIWNFCYKKIELFTIRVCKLSLDERDCEIKSVNRHSMIIDGAVSSWNELIALVYFIGKFVIMKDRKNPIPEMKGHGK